jgi:MoxR-like ATPase
MAGTIHIVGWNEVLFIVEMRILEFLVPLGQWRGGMFWLLSHDIIAGGKHVSTAGFHYMRWKRAGRYAIFRNDGWRCNGAFMNIDDLEINRKARQLRATLDPLYKEVEKVIVGQRAMIDRLLIGLLTGGHILVEGVPGLAKTLAIRTLAQALRLSFHRIQFTPDLLPADVIGTQIYNPRTGEFSVKKGPVFANLVLADEINRAPAKVQSALLEAMQEKQVTIGDHTYPLEQPFLVLATQNPIEQEGTYPLPEAQVDRFMLKLKITYPNKEEELAILERMVAVEPDLAVGGVMGAEEILKLRRGIDELYVDEKIKRYVIDIVHATRAPANYGLDISSYIQYGASPRATIFLTRAAKGLAFLEGRGYVTPHDVKTIGYDVLRHRLIVTYEAEAEDVTAENLLHRIFDHLPVP